MATRLNGLDQELDILGSDAQNGFANIADEPNFLGEPITGQTGNTAATSAAAGGVVTLTGLTGMTAASVSRFLTLSGAANAGNNGTFLIVAYIDPTSVNIANASGVASDANNNTILWAERRPYCLEDDLDYERSDRQLIKGVPYYSPVPTYVRPDAVTTNVPANLANIAGKTTDAKAFVINQTFVNIPVSIGATYVIITSTGNLKWADAVDRLGVPIFDGADAGNWESCYVEIIAGAEADWDPDHDGDSETELTVVGGPYDGYRIFGISYGGLGTSPDSFELEFRCVAQGSDISTSVPYTWDGYQPDIVNIYYPFRVRLDEMDENALRTLLVNGLASDSSALIEINNILSTIGTTSGQTSLAGLLTNIGADYAFHDLGTATPTVVDALNVLNLDIGNRIYTGSLLTNGQTITASLEALASAITTATSQRVIERLASEINANTPHTLPGGISYTLDGTGNGKNMWVFVRGLLQDPGTLTQSTQNSYVETSTTSVTFYQKVKSGDHINYVIYQ